MPDRPDLSTIRSQRLGPPVEDEAERLIQCPICDGWIDMRRLDDVARHLEPSHEGPAVQ